MAISLDQIIKVPVYPIDLAKKERKAAHRRLGRDRTYLTWLRTGHLDCSFVDNEKIAKKKCAQLFFKLARQLFATKILFTGVHFFFTRIKLHASR